MDVGVEEGVDVGVEEGVDVGVEEGVEVEVGVDEVEVVVVPPPQLPSNKLAITSIGKKITINLFIRFPPDLIVFYQSRLLYLSRHAQPPGILIGCSHLAL